MIRFSNLPGVQHLEEEMMIAHKFHQVLPKHRIDDLSCKLFGITRDDVSYPLPAWFVDGFRNFSDWESSGEYEVGPYYTEDAFYEDEELFYFTFEDGADLRRNDLMAGAVAFWSKMKVAQGVSDPYEMMNVARSLGIDFSDQTGKHPILVTSSFFLQALAVASGAAGHMPDVEELQTGEWAAKMESAARRFKRRSG